MMKSFDELFTKLAPRYLAFWARYVLAAHNPRIVGITGSVGKTTTKEIIAATLAQPEAQPAVGRVRKTAGNMNNNVGLPLTVLGYDDWPGSLRGWIKTLLTVPLRAMAVARSSEYPDVLVLEYAAGWDGDVPRLARVAPPTVAVVTAIGPAHLERFRTVEGVAEHKAALVKAVPASGLVVLGADTPHSAAMAVHSVAPVRLVCGRGRELATNAARVVAEYFQLPGDSVERALTNPIRTSGRLDVKELEELTLIDDSFNANPLSMKFALDSFGQIAKSSQRRVAILGNMAELGDASYRYHHELGAYVAGRADLLIAVGTHARRYGGHYWFPDAQSCATALPSIIQRGDCVLVKGSHSVGLRVVAKSLRKLIEERAVRNSADQPL